MSNPRTVDLLDMAKRPLPELKVHGDELLLLVRLTLCLHKKTAPGSCFKDNQYDAVRGCWRLNLKHAMKVDYVLGIDKDPKTKKNRVCAVLALDKNDPHRCEQVKTDDYGVVFKGTPHIRFNGKLDNTLDYFCTDASKIRFNNPVRYVDKDTLKALK